MAPIKMASQTIVELCFENPVSMIFFKKSYFLIKHIWKEN